MPKRGRSSSFSRRVQKQIRRNQETLKVENTAFCSHDDTNPTHAACGTIYNGGLTNGVTYTALDGTTVTGAAVARGLMKGGIMKRYVQVANAGSNNASQKTSEQRTGMKIQNCRLTLRGFIRARQSVDEKSTSPFWVYMVVYRNKMDPSSVNGFYDNGSAANPDEGPLLLMSHVDQQFPIKYTNNALKYKLMKWNKRDFQFIQVRKWKLNPLDMDGNPQTMNDYAALAENAPYASGLDAEDALTPYSAPLVNPQRSRAPNWVQFKQDLPCPKNLNFALNSSSAVLHPLGVKDYNVAFFTFNCDGTDQTDTAYRAVIEANLTLTYTDS